MRMSLRVYEKPRKNRAVKKKKIVQTFPNFLSKEDWDTSFFEYSNDRSGGYGHAFGKKDAVSSFCPLYWEMMLDDDDFFVEHVFNKIKEVTGDDLVLKKVELEVTPSAHLVTFILTIQRTSHGLSYIMPVQTCGNQCGVVRQSFIQRVEIQSIKSL